MPKFMDVHHGMHGITPEALQAAHQADLDIQGEEDVDFQRAWGDPEFRDGLVRVGSAECRRRPQDPRANRPSGNRGLPHPGRGLNLVGR